MGCADGVVAGGLPPRTTPDGVFASPDLAPPKGRLGRVWFVALFKCIDLRERERGASPNGSEAA